jgi:uncharacterized membrane protein (UPF0127 family)
MIRNKSKGSVVSEDFVVCNGILSKARGMMFRKTPKSMIFAFRKEKIVPLHMMFVFFPIDVLFIDKDKRIVEIKRDFRPFGYYSPEREAQYVVEMAAGMADGCDVGDVVSF